MANAKMFRDLKQGLAEIQAHRIGQKVDLRVTVLPDKPRELKPKEIRDIRLGLNATQVVFAAYLNVHANTVRSWEQGTRKPRAGDLKLLSIAKMNPQALLSPRSATRR